MCGRARVKIDYGLLSFGASKCSTRMNLVRAKAESNCRRPPALSNSDLREIFYRCGMIS